MRFRSGRMREWPNAFARCYIRLAPHVTISLRRQGINPLWRPYPAGYVQTERTPPRTTRRRQKPRRVARHESCSQPWVPSTRRPMAVPPSTRQPERGRTPPWSCRDVSGEPDRLRGQRGAEGRQAGAVEHAPERQPGYRPTSPVAEGRESVDPGSRQNEPAPPGPVHPDSQERANGQGCQRQDADDEPDLGVVPPSSSTWRGEGRQEVVERREVDER